MTMVSSRPGQRSSRESGRGRSSPATPVSSTPASTQPTQASQQAAAQAKLNQMKDDKLYVDNTPPSSNTLYGSGRKSDSNTNPSQLGPGGGGAFTFISRNTVGVTPKDKNLYPTESGGAASPEKNEGKHITLTPPGAGGMGGVRFAQPTMESARETSAREQAEGLARQFNQSKNQVKLTSTSSSGIKYDLSGGKAKLAPASLSEGKSAYLSKRTAEINKSGFFDDNRGVQVWDRREFGSAASNTIANMEWTYKRQLIDITQKPQVSQEWLVSETRGDKTRKFTTFSVGKPNLTVESEKPPLNDVINNGVIGITGFTLQDKIRFNAPTGSTIMNLDSASLLYAPGVILTQSTRIETPKALSNTKGLMGLKLTSENPVKNMLLAITEKDIVPEHTFNVAGLEYTSPKISVVGWRSPVDKSMVSVGKGMVRNIPFIGEPLGGFLFGNDETVAQAQIRRAGGVIGSIGGFGVFGTTEAAIANPLLNTIGVVEKGALSSLSVLGFTAAMQATAGTISKLGSESSSNLVDIYQTNFRSKVPEENRFMMDVNTFMLKGGVNLANTAIELTAGVGAAVIIPAGLQNIQRLSTTKVLTGGTHPYEGIGNLKVGKTTIHPTEDGSILTGKASANYYKTNEFGTAKRLVSGDVYISNTKAGGYKTSITYSYNQGGLFEKNNPIIERLNLPTGRLNTNFEQNIPSRLYTDMSRKQTGKALGDYRESLEAPSVKRLNILEGSRPAETFSSRTSYGTAELLRYTKHPAPYTDLGMSVNSNLKYSNFLANKIRINTLKPDSYGIEGLTNFRQPASTGGSLAGVTPRTYERIWNAPYAIDETEAILTQRPAIMAGRMVKSTVTKGVGGGVLPASPTAQAFTYFGKSNLILAKPAGAGETLGFKITSEGGGINLGNARFNSLSGVSEIRGNILQPTKINPSGVTHGFEGNIGVEKMNPKTMEIIGKISNFKQSVNSILQMKELPVTTQSASYTAELMELNKGTGTLSKYFTQTASPFKQAVGFGPQPENVMSTSMMGGFRSGGLVAQQSAQNSRILFGGATEILTPFKTGGLTKDFGGMVTQTEYINQQQNKRWDVASLLKRSSASSMMQTNMGGLKLGGGQELKLGQNNDMMKAMQLNTATATLTAQKQGQELRLLTGLKTGTGGGGGDGGGGGLTKILLGGGGLKGFPKSPFGSPPSLGGFGGSGKKLRGVLKWSKRNPWSNPFATLKRAKRRRR